MLNMTKDKGTPPLRVAGVAALRSKRLSISERMCATAAGVYYYLKENGRCDHLNQIRWLNAAAHLSWSYLIETPGLHLIHCLGSINNALGQKEEGDKNMKGMSDIDKAWPGWHPSSGGELVSVTADKCPLSSLTFPGPSGAVGAWWGKLLLSSCLCATGTHIIQP